MPRQITQQGTREHSAWKQGTGLLTLLALLCLSPTGSFGASEISQDQRQEVLATAATQIAAHYLDSDLGKEIAKGLGEEMTGREKLLAPEVFAGEVTRALFTLSGDRHLSLKWMPQAMALQTEASGVDAPPDYGVKRVEVLDGNIGYLRLDGFHAGLTARERLTAALILLESSDGLILDLRENGGGASDMVRFLQSCFFASPTVVMLYEDAPGVRTESWTGRGPAGVTCAGKPLLVLVGPRTASAAEDFALSVQAFGLGHLVGEKSAGAANFIRHFWLEPGFRLSVSVGRPLHPKTLSNWEGVGLTPDFAVKAEAAFEAAHIKMLETLFAKSGSGQLRYSLLLKKKRAETYLPGMKALRAHVGRYEALRVDLLRDGLQLHGLGYNSPLLPLEPQVFQMTAASADHPPQPLVLFRASENETDSELVLLYPDGREQVFIRYN